LLRTVKINARTAAAGFFDRDAAMVTCSQLP